MNVLQEWQRTQIQRGAGVCLARKGPETVTVLAYHFFDETRFDAHFDYLDCAIRETWRHCGMLKTVLVVNMVTPRLEAFAGQFGGWVKVDVTDRLVPGSIFSMNADCNCNLHKRFDSEYVLVVQTDGFPIRPGLEAFLGKWDFVGAPYVRDTLRNRLVCGLFNCWVSNGGFSLRTKAICELASFYWNKKYFKMPECRAVSEDIFYTETLPLRERGYRRQVRIADHRQALPFAYDAVFPYAADTAPFGFHTAKAFEFLKGRGWITEQPM